jgi:hypothetical protein
MNMTGATKHGALAWSEALSVFLEKTKSGCLWWCGAAVWRSAGFLKVFFQDYFTVFCSLQRVQVELDSLKSEKNRVF